MASLSTDSKEVWIRPKRQSQHHKLCLEANTQPSTDSSASVSCAYSKIPCLLSRLLAFSTSSLFPHAFSSLCCIAVLKSRWQNMVTAPRSIATRKGHSARCHAETGWKKGQKSTKQQSSCTQGMGSLSSQAIMWNSGKIFIPPQPSGTKWRHNGLSALISRTSQAFYSFVYSSQWKVIA